MYLNAPGLFKKAVSTWEQIACVPGEDSEGRVVPAETEIETMLRNKGILASQEIMARQYNTTDQIISDWVDRISTKAAALWACNSTAAIVQGILSSLPPPGDTVAKMTREAYSKAFQQIS